MRAVTLTNDSRYIERDKKAPMLMSELLMWLLIGVSCVRIIAYYTFFSFGGSVSLTLTATSAVLVAAILLFEFQRLDRGVQFFWICFAVLMFASYLKNGTGMEYLCNTVVLFGVLSVSGRLRFKKRLIKLIVIFYLCVVLLVAVFANKFDSADAGSALIVNNTNHSGFIMMACEIMFMILAQKHPKRSRKRRIYWILFAVAFIVHIQFASRSSLIGTVLFFAYSLLKNRIDELGPKSICFSAIVLCVAGILFAYLYAVVLFDLIGQGEITILGKDLFTGRQTIWRDAFEQMKGNLLLGAGNTLDSRNENAHNQFVGWLLIYGLPAFAAIILLMASILKSYAGKHKSKNMVAVMLILVVASYAETYFYSGINSIIVILIVISASVDVEMGEASRFLSGIEHRKGRKKITEKW